MGSHEERRHGVDFDSRFIEGTENTEYLMSFCALWASVVIVWASVVIVR
jgi:hypothetical protein